MYSAVTVTNVFLLFYDPSRDEQTQTVELCFGLKCPKYLVQREHEPHVVHDAWTRSCGYHRCTCSSPADKCSQAPAATAGIRDDSDPGSFVPLEIKLKGPAEALKDREIYYSKE